MCLTTSCHASLPKPLLPRAAYLAGGAISGSINQSVLNFVDISHEDVHQHSKLFKSFALLVYGVLMAFPGAPHTIKKFHLECAHSCFEDKFRAYSVEMWVRAAIDLQPKELDLNLY